MLSITNTVHYGGEARLTEYMDFVIFCKLLKYKILQNPARCLLLPFTALKDGVQCS